MDYEKLHKDTIAKLQEIVNRGKITAETARGICADFVPESEDKMMIKFIKNQLFNIKKTITENYELDAKLTKAIDWLEKQGEKGTNGNEREIPFSEQKPADKVEPKFKIGQTIKKEGFNLGFTIVKIEDGFYYNDMGDNFPFTDQDNWELVEQKSIDKVDPKFKVGDWLVNIECGNVVMVLEVLEDNYKLDYSGDTIGTLCTELVDNDYRLWDITKDTKDGDVLAVEEIEEKYQYPFVAIYKERGLDFFNSYCSIGFDGKFCEADTGHSTKKIHPATKEQRDTLMKAMANAGYTFDFEKKELRKIEQEQTKFPNGEDYGIDGLYHAISILERTLGKVDGYQSDDGILEHKCAIEAVNRLYKQNPTWSEEDEEMLNSIVARLHSHPNVDLEEYSKEYNWLNYTLKSLRPQNTWKPSDNELEVLRLAAEKDGACLMGLYEQLKKLRK